VVCVLVRGRWVRMELYQQHPRDAKKNTTNNTKKDLNPSEQKTKNGKSGQENQKTPTPPPTPELHPNKYNITQKKTQSEIETHRWGQGRAKRGKGKHWRKERQKKKKKKGWTRSHSKDHKIKATNRGKGAGFARTIRSTWSRKKLRDTLHLEKI